MGNPIFIDMTSSATAVMNHPVDIVWPHLLDHAAYMKEYKVESIAGRHNTLGEIKRVSALPGKAEFIPFFFKTLRLVPCQKFIYKAYTERRDGPYAFTGVEILALKDVAEGRSAVCFEAFLEMQSVTMSREELTAFVHAVRVDALAMWERNLARLASLM